MTKDDHLHAHGVDLNMWLKVMVVENWMFGGKGSKLAIVIWCFDWLRL